MKMTFLTFLLLTATSYAKSNIDTVDLKLDYNKYTEAFEPSSNTTKHIQAKLLKQKKIKQIKLTKSEKLRKKTI